MSINVTKSSYCSQT